MGTKVLILCPYPRDSAAGQRFRFEQYLEILSRANIEATVEPFLGESAWQILYEPGHFLTKMWAVLLGFWKRSRTLLCVHRYDYIFIYREATPLGPPVVEFFLFALRCRVIYDFDDAIFTSDQPENRLTRLLKWRSKVAYITKRGYKVTVSTPFLFEWASRLNHNAVLLPSTIDPAYHQLPRRARDGSRPVIGWTGTHSTVKYLELVRPVMEGLQEKYDFEFRVICSIDPGFAQLRHYRFMKWRLSTEIQDLSALDIGLMPLPEGTWERAKAGFKAIQYSALGIVPVVSAVGCGAEVVRNGETGFVVSNTEAEWRTALETLLQNRDTWPRIGKAAREYILRTYSVPAQAEAYIAMFK